MSAQTSIEWTDRSWNPVRGCSRVSPGCDHCYAMRQAHRFNTSSPKSPYHGLTVLRPKDAKRPGVDWSGRVRLVPDMLSEPLSWRKPQRVFVNSMSDLFHEALTNEEIAAVFGVMAAAPQHTFQVLTKRPKRAAAWFKWIKDQEEHDGGPSCAQICALMAANRGADVDWLGVSARWPLPNVWLGVSAENQETYNERVPVLVHQCAAALFWVSAEPLLGPLQLRGTGHIHLGWIVVGGESGNGARPFDTDWARSLIAEGRESGIPIFVKQLGARPGFPIETLEDLQALQAKRELKQRKWNEPHHWPADLRVREFPGGT